VKGRGEKKNKRNVLQSRSGGGHERKIELAGGRNFVRYHHTWEGGSEGKIDTGPMCKWTKGEYRHRGANGELKG